MIKPITDYSDIEKNLFVTSILVDINEDDTYSVYFECFKTTTKTSNNIAEGERLVIHVNATTLDDLITNAVSQASLKITYSQNRVLLFTKKAAAKGIDDILNLFTHSPEFVVSSQIGIWGNDPERINTIILKGERFLGPYLSTQFKNTSLIVSNSNMETVRKLFNDSTIGSKISFAPIISIDDTTAGTKLEISGAGVLKNYKLIDTLKSSQIIDVNFLTDNILATVIKAENPDIPDKSVALRVLKSKTKTKYRYDAGRFLVNKDVVIHCVFDGSQNKLNLSNENVKKIEEGASDILKKKWNILFKEYQLKDIDVLGIEKQFYRHFPHQSNKDLLNRTMLSLEVKVIVDSTSDPKDFTD